MQVYLGIDWSSKKHDIVITDEKGKRISAGVMEHSQTGFAKLEQMRKQLGITQDEWVMGLETAHTRLFGKPLAFHYLEDGGDRTRYDEADHLQQRLARRRAH